MRGQRAGTTAASRTGRGRRAGAGLVAVGLLAAACDDGGDASPPTTDAIVVPSTTSTLPPRPDDGRLTLGLLLPRSGLARPVGQDLWDAATNAIQTINQAGGVHGQQIVTVTADEGETSAATAQAVNDLIDQNVDAVVGPASSTSALATLDLLLSAGVLTCSPTATALALDDYPNRDLFFRTAPSDSLQAAALARVAQDTGRTTVAITWIDDVYGRPFATAVTNSTGLAIGVVSRQPFTNASDLEDVAATVLAEDPGVIIVIADGDLGTRMITALADEVAADPESEIPEILVNDAMRTLSPSYRQRIADLPEQFRQHIRGLSPKATGEGEVPGAFATNAFDCVTLIALAAHLAGPDDTVAMRATLTDLTATGGQCRDFESCADLLDSSLNIDYEGPTGPVEIGPDGDPLRARFDIFHYSAEGVDFSEGSPQTFAR